MQRNSHPDIAVTVALDACIDIGVGARDVLHCDALLPNAALLLAGLLLRLPRSRCAMN